MLRVAALVAAVVAVSGEASTFSRSTACAQTCDDTAGNFLYKEGTVHEFDYQASAHFLGGDVSPYFGVSAKAQITVASRCEMILAVSHVKFLDISSHEQPVHEDFSGDLIKNPLRFGFVNGVVASVCPAGDEPRWALNFKRAILSNFQNSMINFNSNAEQWLQEDDVSGLCTSNYTSKQVERGTYTVTRHRADPCVPPTPPPTNNLKSQFAQMLPIVYKKQLCRQTIANKTLRESVCEESIRLPWDSEDEAPVANVKTSLKFVHNYDADFVVIPNYQATRLGLALQWEDTSDDLPPPEWLSLATDLVERLTDAAPAPALFNQLTEVMKHFSYQQIVDLFTTLRPHTWATASAAVQQLGTPAAFKILKEFIADGYSYSGVSDVAELLMNYMKTFELSPELLDLISENFNEVQRSWGGEDAAIVKVKNHCKHDVKCYKGKSVAKILKKLENAHAKLECMKKEEYYLSDRAWNETTEQDYFEFMNPHVSTLEAFNKLGFWNRTLVSEVLKCAHSGYKPAQFAALEALKNVPCDWIDYDALMNSFNKKSLDDDESLGVLFYMTVMRCEPTGISEKLKKKLLEKDVSQFTSFVWSHLSNMKNDIITREILNDPTLKNKYAASNLRFSRNYKKDVVLMNKTFNVEVNMVFTEKNMRPQYFSMNVLTENNSVDFMKIESKTKNISNSKIVSICTVEVMGKLMYEEEKHLDGANNHFEALDVVMPVLHQVMEETTSFVADLSLNQVGKWLGLDFSDVDYTKHFMLMHYPTSLGMPFNIRVNKTEGSLSQDGNFPSFYAKQLEMSMLVDATYANIGTSMKASCRMMPKFNITFFNPIQIIVSLPEERTEFAEFNIGRYNIKNDVLTPRYRARQQAEKSVCIPGMKNLTGATPCFVYTPNEDWLPRSECKYKIVKERNNDFRGYNFTYSFDDSSSEVSCDKIGNPSQRYSFRWSNLAQIFNMKLQCPHFTMEGSGTLSAKEEVMNITGLLTCSKDVAPFTLTGSKSFYDERTNASRYEANFNSSIFQSKMISDCTTGDNTTANIVKTYWSKYHPVNEKVVMSMKCLQIDVAPNVSRHETEAHFSCTKYPKTKFDMEAHCDHDEAKDSYDFDGFYKASFTDNTTITHTCKGKCYDVETHVVSFFNYSHPELNATFDESLHMLTLADKSTSNKVVSIGLCNNKTAYEFEANCGHSPDGSMYFNKTLLVPYKENQSKMWFSSKTRALCDIALRKAEFECVKTLENDSMSVNMSVAAVTDSAGVPLFQLDRDYGYRASMEAKCSSYEPLTFQAQSKMSKDHQNMDMDLSVKTPFKAWNKPELLLKLKKTGPKMKASFTSKNDRKKPETYSMEGVSDYDIYSNFIA